MGYQIAQSQKSRMKDARKRNESYPPRLHAVSSSCSGSSACLRPVTFDETVQPRRKSGTEEEQGEEKRRGKDTISIFVLVVVIIGKGRIGQKKGIGD